MRYVALLALLLSSTAMAVDLPCEGGGGGASCTALTCSDPNNPVLTAVSSSCTFTCGSLPTTSTTATTSTTTTTTLAAQYTLPTNSFEAGGDIPITDPNNRSDEFNDPNLNARWTQQNAVTSGLTLAQSNGAMRVRVNVQSGDEIGAITEPAPGTPYTVTARIGFGCPMAAFNYAGVFLRNSSNGRMVALQMAALFSAAAELSVDEYSSFSGGSAGNVFRDDLDVEYLKFVNDGTTVTYYASADGVAWRWVQAQALSTYLTAAGGSVDQIGIHAGSADGTHTSEHCDAIAYWFRVQ